MPNLNLPKWVKNYIAAIVLLFGGWFGGNAIAGDDAPDPSVEAAMVLEQAADLAELQVQVNSALADVDQLNESYEEANDHVLDLADENLALREALDAALGDIDPDADKGGVVIDGIDFGPDATSVEPLLPEGMIFIIATKCPYTPTGYADDFNKKDFPVVIYEVPADTRVRFECGEAVLVQAEPVKSDGGDLFYLVEGPRGIGRYLKVSFGEPVTP